MSYRDRLAVGARWQLRLTRGLQVAMVGLFAVGLATKNTGVVVNAAAAFGVSLLPEIGRAHV